MSVCLSISLSVSLYVNFSLSFWFFFGLDCCSLKQIAYFYYYYSRVSFYCPKRLQQRNSIQKNKNKRSFDCLFHHIIFGIQVGIYGINATLANNSDLEAKSSKKISNTSKIYLFIPSLRMTEVHLDYVKSSSRFAGLVCPIFSVSPWNSISISCAFQ